MRHENGGVVATSVRLETGRLRKLTYESWQYFSTTYAVNNQIHWLTCCAGRKESLHHILRGVVYYFIGTKRLDVVGISERADCRDMAIVCNFRYCGYVRCSILEGRSIGKSGFDSNS
jgi:hypothetical protein